MNLTFSVNQIFSSVDKSEYLQTLSSLTNVNWISEVSKSRNGLRPLRDHWFLRLNHPYVRVRPEVTGIRARNYVSTATENMHTQYF